MSDFKPFEEDLVVVGSQVIDIQKIEQDLVAAVETAQADGITLVSEEFGLYITSDGSIKFENPVARCACLVGALAYADSKDSRLVGPNLTGHFSNKYGFYVGYHYHWALIDGFDGTLEQDRYVKSQPYHDLYQLGARLRERFSPVKL